MAFVLPSFFFPHLFFRETSQHRDFHSCILSIFFLLDSFRGSVGLLFFSFPEAEHSPSQEGGGVLSQSLPTVVVPPSSLTLTHTHTMTPTHTPPPQPPDSCSHRWQSNPPLSNLKVEIKHRQNGSNPLLFAASKDVVVVVVVGGEGVKVMCKDSEEKDASETFFNHSFFGFSSIISFSSLSPTSTCGAVTSLPS